MAGLFYTTYSLICQNRRGIKFSLAHSTRKAFCATITDYLSVVLVGPVFVFTAFGLTASAQVIGSSNKSPPFNHSDTSWFGQQAPALYLYCFVFTFLYKFVPYTTVKLSSALVGGATAGVLWQVAGLAFASFVATSGKYSAIYSSFAVLILFSDLVVCRVADCFSWRTSRLLSSASLFVFDANALEARYPCV